MVSFEIKKNKNEITDKLNHMNKVTKLHINIGFLCTTTTCILILRNFFKRACLIFNLV